MDAVIISGFVVCYIDDELKIVDIRGFRAHGFPVPKLPIIDRGSHLANTFLLQELLHGNIKTKDLLAPGVH